jgi:hypothetical protein
VLFEFRIKEAEMENEGRVKGCISEILKIEEG